LHESGNPQGCCEQAFAEIKTLICWQELDDLDSLINAA
jgi:hypothetical protein